MPNRFGPGCGCCGGAGGGVRCQGAMSVTVHFPAMDRNPAVFFPPLWTDQSIAIDITDDSGEGPPAPGGRLLFRSTGFEGQADTPEYDITIIGFTLGGEQWGFPLSPCIYRLWVGPQIIFQEVEYTSPTIHGTYTRVTPPFPPGTMGTYDWPDSIEVSGT